MAERKRSNIIFPHVPYSQQVPFTGKETIREVLDEMMRCLNRRGLVSYYKGVYLEDWEYFGLGTDVKHPDEFNFHPDGPFPHDCRLAIYAVTGGSEGWYVHLDAYVHQKKYFTNKHDYNKMPFVHSIPANIFLGKTFMGMVHAMQMVAGMTAVLGV